MGEWVAGIQTLSHLVNTQIIVHAIPKECKTRVVYTLDLSQTRDVAFLVKHPPHTHTQKKVSNQVFDAFYLV
jgi:hypothetical protein